MRGKRLAGDGAADHALDARLEHELAAQIQGMIDPVADGRRLVFNFHCPPYDSGLDKAQALDDDFRPIVRNNAVKALMARVRSATICSRATISTRNITRGPVARGHRNRELSTAKGRACDSDRVQGVDLADTAAPRSGHR